MNKNSEENPLCYFWPGQGMGVSMGTLNWRIPFLNLNNPSTVLYNIALELREGENEN